jgi:hypothetical protein
MLSGSKGVFDAVALVHPAMLSVDDVKELSVPLAIFPSKVGDPWWKGIIGADHVSGVDRTSRPMKSRRS